MNFISALFVSNFSRDEAKKLTLTSAKSVIAFCLVGKSVITIEYSIFTAIQVFTGDLRIIGIRRRRKITNSSDNNDRLVYYLCKLKCYLNLAKCS